MNDNSLCKECINDNTQCDYLKGNNSYNQLSTIMVLAFADGAECTAAHCTFCLLLCSMNCNHFLPDNSTVLTAGTITGCFGPFFCLTWMLWDCLILICCGQK